VFPRVFFEVQKYRSSKQRVLTGQKDPFQGLERFALRKRWLSFYDLEDFFLFGSFKPSCIRTMARGEAGLPISQPRRVTPEEGPGTRVRIYMQALHAGTRQTTASKGCLLSGPALQCGTQESVTQQPGRCLPQYLTLKALFTGFQNSYAVLFMSIL